MRKSNWPYVILILTIGAAILIISNYRFNYSNSEPIGIWRLTSIYHSVKRGDHVALCHNIIKKNKTARCYPFLIKTVVGIPGDKIIINNQGVEINQKLLAHSQILSSQKSIYTTQTMVTLPIHYYWVYGSNNPYFSNDSRYFGPVNDTDIIAITYPVILYHRHQ
ncbi:signal peptidase I [Ferrovum sp. PN-J185]|uniref:signal peptidase I n=1 Tax=Ferrovum sp. PN-J185 TaxID=1356306 RepID=UPI0007995847|nr:signal peptidase I [Ferrovum sp. PN-J185]KXW56482.1 peptidase S26 [Ferrovum sp. PN-J185]MCC6068169.1 signal peptidase I [Ferrovum sp. PN-J185]